jgi:alpha-L-fucosidase
MRNIGFQTAKLKGIKLGVLLFCCSMSSAVLAQEHHLQKYYPPTDTLVQNKLEQWGDFKFGLLMHWGPYSQWGIVESWSICPEDEPWCERRGPYAQNYFEYKKAYEGLQNTLNPVKFNPEKWASAARSAGMKYMVFTTKHHDGFAMFDTKFSDYKITSPNTPFHTNPRANIAKEVFDAFRKEGLWVGAYFSKPDWHSPYYWDPYFPPMDRNPNYDLEKYPEKWDKFREFTTHQIEELVRDYGKMDLLWLDGGQVQPASPGSGLWKGKVINQDIKMDEIAKMARSYQPGLIVVDRAVEGPNQNYLTPEQQIPQKPLSYPWETCMTMGGSWSYVKNEQYKPIDEIIRNLCLIVSRGGNYLLNIAPSETGEWDSAAYTRLEEIGAWMKVNGEAIYGTEPIEPYEQQFYKDGRSADGNVRQEWVFTSKLEAGKWVVYAILQGNQDFGKAVNLDLSVLAKVWSERRDLSLPADVASKAVSGCRVQLLGYGAKPERLSVLGDQTLKLPKELDWKDRSLESTGPRGMRLMRPAPYRNMPPALVWRLEFE